MTQFDIALSGLGCGKCVKKVTDMGRTPAEAQAGTLDAMVGCDDATWDIIAPVIDCWAGNVTRTGGTGSGHQMKLLMNFLAWGYGALYSRRRLWAPRSASLRRPSGR